MKALSLGQASSCENATSPASQCKCRCGGKLHGAGRSGSRSIERSYFQELPADDPHKLPPEVQRELDGLGNVPAGAARIGATVNAGRAGYVLLFIVAMFAVALVFEPAPLDFRLAALIPLFIAGVVVSFFIGRRT